MRKFALLASAWMVFSSALLHAQQVDVAVGAGILVSTKNTSASQAFPPPGEDGGIYPSVDLDVFLNNPFFKRNHLGINGEIAVRARQGLYNGYQDFRPVFYDLNLVSNTRLTKKFSLDVMAGVGGESVLFYNHVGLCSSSYTFCATNITSNHFLVDFGGGVRYYLPRRWHRFFVRPEAHLYIIPDNSQFHSDFVGRVGGSLGYDFARK